MPRSFKTNTLIVLALAATFYFFFMFTKHDPAVSAIIPFASDPYDAIGSFGVIVAVLLGALSLFRVFRPYRFATSSGQQETYLVRTHMAIVLGVLIPLAGDFVAMARHLSKWMNTPATGELILLSTGMVAFSLVVLFLVRYSAHEIDLPTMPNEWQKSFVISLVCVAILAVYPENIIQSVFGELFSLGVGIFLLFVPQSALVKTLVPYEAGKTESDGGTSGLFSRHWIQWGAVALLGFAVGAFLLLAEMGEGGGDIRNVPIVHLLTVATVFIGASTFGLLVGYGLLRKPLGLFRQRS
jgi:hypothetical protein